MSFARSITLALFTIATLAILGGCKQMGPDREVLARISDNQNGLVFRLVKVQLPTHEICITETLDILERGRTTTTASTCDVSEWMQQTFRNIAKEWTERHRQTTTIPKDIGNCDSSTGK